MSKKLPNSSTVNLNESFRQRVLSVVRKIPKGSVRTYGEVAKLAGVPNAARAVGTIMAANYDKTVPCHRVIRGDGTIGRYNRGDEQKPIILAREGVKLVTRGLIIKVVFA